MYPSLAVLDPTIDTATAAAADSRGTVLVPLIGWLPHRNWRNEEELHKAGETPAALKHARLAVASTETGLEFSSRRVLPAGRSVALTDAHTTSLAQRAVERGAVFTRGPYFVYLRIPSPELLNDTCGGCLAEELLQAKLKVLTEHKLPTWMNHIPVYSDGNWPSELVVALRIILAPPEQAQLLYDAAEGQPLGAANDALVTRVLNSMITTISANAALAPASRPGWVPADDNQWPALRIHQFWLVIKSLQDHLVANLQSKLPIRSGGSASASTAP